MCHQSPLSLLMSPLTSYKGSHRPGWTDEHYRPGQLTPPLSLLYIVCDMWRVIMSRVSADHTLGWRPLVSLFPGSHHHSAPSRDNFLPIWYSNHPLRPQSGWKLAGVLAGHYARLAIQIVPRVRLTAAITVRAGFRDQSFDTIKT